MEFYIVIVLCTCCILDTASASLNILKYDSPTALGTSFQKVKVDVDSGDVFVAGRNTLYKLDDNLNFVNMQLTGPYDDNIMCDPQQDACDDAQISDNDARVLEINPSSRHLVLCGSLKQGLCSMYTMSFLNKSQDLPVSNPVNYAGGRAGVSSFYGHWGSHSADVDTLWLANTYDGRPTQLATPALSARRIVKLPDGTFNMSYAREDAGTSTSIEFDPRWLTNYLVKYVYGFEHGGFTYFVTIQRENTEVTTNYQTKLVRVCQEDTGFNSYAELELTCRKKNGVTTFYNIAQAASLSPIGEEMAKKFALHAREDALYVILGKSLENSSESHAEYGSGMCVFTMSKIREAFKTEQRYCYQGYGRLVPWITSAEPPCTEDNAIAARITESFCGNPKNVGIKSRYPLQTETNLTNSGFLATSLALWIHEGETVAIIGTTRGRILKVLIDGTDSPPYADIDVGALLEHPAVAMEMAFDLRQENIYVMTQNRVSKVPVQSCRIYEDCSTCVTTTDPLNCGWCDNHCSTEKECTSAGSWMKDSCPPFIDSFGPLTGPVQGSTKVTIHGHNFGNATIVGSERSTAKVMVALVECLIETRNSTLIICRTGSSSRGSIDREVKVTVVDKSKTTVSYNIRGDATSGHISFSYRKPKLTGFLPRIGPKSGGTELKVSGKNLDIGNHRHISVAGHPCNIISVSSELITCRTSSWLDGQLPAHFFYKRSLDSAQAEGPVNLTIDSPQLSCCDSYVYVYAKDPEITTVYPRKSIVSGGVPVTVIGSNLHVVQKPLIQITMQGSGETFTEHCEAHANGLRMICWTPSIATFAFDLIPGDILNSDLHFILDDVIALREFKVTHPDLGVMQYSVDPVFHRFSSYNNERTFYMDENYLDIQGQYLDFGIEVQHLRVFIGDEACNVTQLGSTVLICHPEKPFALTDDQYDVVVTVGLLTFEIGSLQFAERPTGVLIVAIPVALACALILFVLLILLLKCRKCGPFEKKLKEPTGSDPVRYSEIAGTQGEVNYRHAENSYWSQSQVLQTQPVATPAETALIDDEAHCLIHDADLLIQRDRLLLLEVIGQGHFGCVYRGFLKSQNTKEEAEVAVKTLKTLTENALYASSYDARVFLNEALTMQEFDHPHILRLIGITLDKENLPLVILPFMKHGDLLSYIRDEGNSPTVKDLMEFSINIASGMAYLSGLKFVHRDLAARNCMLDDNMEVKVADFGLSRDIYERDYYSSDDRKAKLPVKWMALESLEKGIYNTKTDVWSYGVVLWELMTRGVCPYPEVDNWDIIKYLKSGRRMPQPSYCPDSLYSVMLQCWDPDSRMRPAFSDLVLAIKKIIDDMERIHSPVGTVSYINVPTSQDYLYPMMPQYEQNDQLLRPEELVHTVDETVNTRQHLLSDKNTPKSTLV